MATQFAADAVVSTTGDGAATVSSYTNLLSDPAFGEVVSFLGLNAESSDDGSSAVVQANQAAVLESLL